MKIFLQMWVSLMVGIALVISIIWALVIWAPWALVALFFAFVCAGVVAVDLNSQRAAREQDENREGRK